MNALELFGSSFHELAVRSARLAARASLLWRRYQLPLGSHTAPGGLDRFGLLVVWLPVCSHYLFAAVSSSGQLRCSNCLGCFPSWGCWDRRRRSTRQTGRVPPEEWLMHPGQDSSVESVTVQLAGLELTISARRLTSADPSQPAEEPSVGPTPEVTSDPYNISTELEEEIIAARDAAALAAVLLPFLTFLEARLTGRHPVWTARARLARAFRAGVIARRHLNGEFQEGTSLGIPYRNSVYIALREPGNNIAGFWTSSYSTYVRRAGRNNPGNGNFHPDSISHAFPSAAEGEAYLLGARRRWPPVAA